MDTRITNVRVLDPVAGDLGRRDILIRGDEIVDVVAPGETVAARQTVDGERFVAIPGLINSHSHSHAGLAKSVGDRWTLEMLQNYGAYTTGNRTLADKQLSAKLTAAEMLLKGCTTCYDLTYEFPAPSPEGTAAIAEAYRVVGQRALLAPMMADRTLYEALPGLLEAIPPDVRSSIDRVRRAGYEVNLRGMREVVRQWSDASGLVELGASPTVPLQCTDEFLLALRDMADELSLRMQTHLDESRVQAVSAQERFGETNTRRLHRLGFLGPRLSVAHAVWPTDDDVALLADAGVGVAHNAGSNMKLGSGLAAIRRMLRLGVKVGIGTDCGVCCDGSNMFESMRLASYVSRVQSDASDQWIAAGEAFALATVGSASVLGYAGRLGRIASGFKADIVLLDLHDIAFVPLNNLVNQVVFSCDAAAVHTVLVGGKVVVEGGKMCTVDMDRLRVEAQEAADRLWRANAEILAAADRLAPTVERHTIALSHRHAHWGHAHPPGRG